jgi:hypothetical protein
LSVAPPAASLFLFLAAFLASALAFFASLSAYMTRSESLTLALVRSASFSLNKGLPKLT